MVCSSFSMGVVCVMSVLRDGLCWVVLVDKVLIVFLIRMMNLWMCVLLCSLLKYS